MFDREVVTLNRDCEAIQVPSGASIILDQGSQVTIVQSLGDSYTVMTDMGFMCRVSGLDADALGKEVKRVSFVDESGNPRPVEDLIWDQLKTCYDPEIPVDIVNLGLVYGCRIHDLEDGKKRVEIKMTLTAPGCGMGDVLCADVRQKIERIPGVSESQVELVWDPIWDQSMMSEAARLKLGMM